MHIHASQQPNDLSSITAAIPGKTAGRSWTSTTTAIISKIANKLKVTCYTAKVSLISVFGIFQSCFCICIFTLLLTGLLLPDFYIVQKLALLTAILLSIKGLPLTDNSSVKLANENGSILISLLTMFSCF